MNGKVGSIGVNVASVRYGQEPKFLFLLLHSQVAMQVESERTGAIANAQEIIFLIIVIGGRLNGISV